MLTLLLYVIFCLVSLSSLIAVKRVPIFTHQSVRSVFASGFASFSPSWRIRYSYSPYNPRGKDELPYLNLSISSLRFLTATSGSTNSIHSVRVLLPHPTVA